MARAKGTPKTGGRIKGTPNRKSFLLSDAFDEIGIDVGMEIALHYQNTPCTNTRLQILYKLLDYIYPKKKSFEVIPPKEESVEKLDYSKLTDGELETLRDLTEKMLAPL